MTELNEAMKKLEAALERCIAATERANEKMDALVASTEAICERQQMMEVMVAGCPWANLGK